MSSGTLPPYIAYNTQCITEDTIMTTKLLTRLLMAALLASSSAFAADTAIQVSMVDGRQQAQFKVGDARCVLVDDEVRCTPVSR